ncbi:hypothetical protein BJY04DRAFT_216335 [Aspergillus karnatakaensis]|uniref:uncharacterized protein n=1 Tax=Aspergillus karnatakaensis TaxID=1810916 RepID=UPI003CCE2D93
MTPNLQLLEAVRIAAMAATNASTIATDASLAAKHAMENAAIAAISAANAARALEIAEQAWREQEAERLQAEQYALHEQRVSQVLEESLEEKCARLGLELGQARAGLFLQRAAESQVSFPPRTVAELQGDEVFCPAVSVSERDVPSVVAEEEDIFSPAFYDEDASSLAGSQEDSVTLVDREEEEDEEDDDEFCPVVGEGYVPSPLPAKVRSPRPRRVHSAQKFLETQRSLEEGAAVPTPVKGEFAFGFAEGEDGFLQRVVGPVEEMVTFPQFVSVKTCPPIFTERQFKCCTRTYLHEKLNELPKKRKGLDLEPRRHTPHVDEMSYGVLEGGEEPEKVKVGFGKVTKVAQNAQVAFVRMF